MDEKGRGFARIRNAHAQEREREQQGRPGQTGATGRCKEVTKAADVEMRVG